MKEPLYSESIGVGAEQLNALRLWQALEILSPQTYKSQHELAETVGGRALILDDKMPWDRPAATGKGAKEFIYHVPLGAINMERSLTALRPVFGDNSEVASKKHASAPLASVMVGRCLRPRTWCNSRTAAIGLRAAA